jgi:hypothetical protein
MPETFRGNQKLSNFLLSNDKNYNKYLEDGQENA